MVPTSTVLCIALGMRLIIYCQINFNDTFVPASRHHAAILPLGNQRQGVAVGYG